MPRHRAIPFVILPVMFCNHGGSAVPQEIRDQPAISLVQNSLLESLARSAPFTKKTWSIKGLLSTFGNSSADEDARPLLPDEFLALPRDKWAKALHPDTAILLVLKLSKKSAQLRPEEAASPEWMVPVLARIQQVGIKAAGEPFRTTEITYFSGNTESKGPNSPTLVFRPNKKSKDPLDGLDRSRPLVGIDSTSRIWARKYSNPNLIPRLYPEWLIPSDQTGNDEIESWIIARIYIARAFGTWDSIETRRTMLTKAKPLIPEWDGFLLEKLSEASKKLR